MAADKPNDSQSKQPGKRQTRIDGAHQMSTDRGRNLPSEQAPEEALATERAEGASIGAAFSQGGLLDRVRKTNSRRAALIASRGKDGPAPISRAADIAQREEQMHQQASEVASHLRTRLRDLDGRETQLHALAAQLENDSRRARLWQQEREQALAEREAAQTKREETFLAAENRLREIRGQASAATSSSQATVETLALQKLELERLQNDMSGREQNLVARQRELADKQRQLTQETQEHRQRASQFESDRASMQQTLKAREKVIREEVEQEMSHRLLDIQAGETLLVEHAKLLDEQRQEVAALRETVEKQQQKQTRELEERQRVHHAELDHARRQLSQRESVMQKRDAEMAQMCAEASDLHRQALEMRLVAEQLWLQISPRVSQETLAQSIAQLRLQLATEHKKQSEQLAKQKADLVALGEKLQAEFTQLEKRRQELQTWHGHKQDQLDSQAKDLTEREGRLVQRQERLQVNVSRMDAQKLSYERQILQLRTGSTKPSKKAA